MSTSILLAYASTYGSTREVAERVASILRDEGVAVDLREMQAVATLTGYGAVVLGAPIYLGRWHPDARHFLERHHEALMARPVAIFALGPVGNDEVQIEAWRGELDAELARHPWLAPVSTRMFGGKYDPAQLGELHTEVAGLPGSAMRDMPANDLRVWEEIEAWAREVAGILKPAMTSREG
jgi:menaquinone-dependent protoporphyrinogen oxidase